MIEIDRRTLLGAAGGALLIGWRDGALAAPATAARDLNDWVRIDSSGVVTVRVNCVEMGQGSQTGFAQILADELEVEWASVRVEQAPVERRWYNPWDNYMTGGSAAIENHIDRLRAMGATARDMLVRAAASRWGVAPDACAATLGRVTHEGSGRVLPYGALAAAAARLTPAATPPLKSPDQWRYISRAMPRLDLPMKVDGTAVYGVDAGPRGVLVGALLQCPEFGGKLRAVDPAPALAIAGVRRIVPLERAVAVVADGYWQAERGLAALKPEWTHGPLAKTSSADISARLRAIVEAGGKDLAQVEGVDMGARARETRTLLAGAARRIVRSYEVPLLSHSPVEPMNATASVSADRAEIWAPTQVQSEMRTDVAKALGLPEASVTIHTTQLGGGFGRRLKTDYGVFAAQVARAVGRPVKLIWGRAEDTRHGFYRPASVAKLEAGFDAAGRVVAARADIASMDGAPWGGIARTPYDLGAHTTASTTWNPGVPIGAWRSVDWTGNTYFLESFIDELAAERGQDPVAYRLALLSDDRLRRLLTAVADRAGWSTPPASHRARGVALCERGGTRCVHIVEASPGKNGGPPKVHRVTAGIDVGLAVNPDQVRAQVEGGVALALSAALAEEITIRDGCVEQAYFDSYPVLRMAQMPPVDVVIQNTPGAKVTGAGEAPVPPLAPALCNALAAATGRRVRRLPIVGVREVAGQEKVSLRSETIPA